MLKTGILNPRLNDLLSRVRHTNTLVIADRGFPFWPQIETVDLSLVDGIPTVLQVLAAVRGNFKAGRAWMAREFVKHNDKAGRLCRGLARHSRGIRTPPPIQKARSGRDWPDPHRRHHSVCQPDPGIGLNKAMGVNAINAP
jgi:D-ribose pyranose/furanose isomerase RbsD